MTLADLAALPAVVLAAVHHAEAVTGCRVASVDVQPGEGGMHYVLRLQTEDGQAAGWYDVFVKEEPHEACG